MIFTLSNEQKLEAAQEGLRSVEEQVFVSAIALNIAVEDIPEDYSSNDPSFALLSEAMDRLRKAKAYLASLS